MTGDVLVTGGSGFIGSHLADRLVAEGARVRVLDPRPPTSDADVEWIDGDVRDADTVRRAARGTSSILHLASVVGVDALLADPVSAIDVAVNGTMRVLDAASDEGASVVHLSTSEVLGTNPAVPWSEDSDRVLGSSLADRWSYGTAKATAEHLVLAWSRTRKVPATIIRPFNVYGPRQEPRFVLASMVAAALGGGPILVDGDGSQTRCFTYIDDMVEGMVRVVRSPGSVPIVHLGSEVETSILRVAELVQAATGGVEIAFRSHDDRWGGLVPEIPRRIPDASVARAVFGWQATTPLEAGIDQLVAWAAGADRVPPAASRIASI